MNKYPLELNPLQTVLVLGGHGFIGRNITAQLEKYGATVHIGSRCTQAPRQLGTRKVLLHNLPCPAQLDQLLDDVDIVVNAVGILRQRNDETYEQVHHLAVARLVTACANKKIRFIHLSALGLHNPVRSRFLGSKLRGEKALMNSTADWFICRPSLIDGDGGYGAKWFRRVAKWPVHFAPANAVNKVAPIHVADVAEAIAKIALSTVPPQSKSARIYELGGREMTIFDYLQALKNAPPLLRLRIPAWLARATSHILDLLHLTPFSFGHYELLRYDNCPTTQQTKPLIGRPLCTLGASTNSPSKQNRKTVVKLH